ncbi:MAG: hypothetical protein R3E85_07060 [Planctomycetota bacterium]
MSHRTRRQRGRRRRRSRARARRACGEAEERARREAEEKRKKDEAAALQKELEEEMRRTEGQGRGRSDYSLIRFPSTRPARPTRAARSLIPRGKATIGTKPQQLASMLEGRPKEQVDVFQFERPQFVVDIGPYLYIRTEVTSAVPAVRQTPRSAYDTSKERLTARTLLARSGASTKEARGPRYRASYQLYLANKDVI